jgi:PAS domain S-box-containing protein
MTSQKPTRGIRTKVTTEQSAKVSKPRKKKLSPNEEKHRYVLANMEEGYYELDLNGNFAFVNPAMCLGMGFDVGELLGRNYRQYVTPESAEKLEATLTKIHRTGAAAKIIEYELVQKDGSRRRHEMSASLLRSTAGEPVGFFGISRDRTDALHLESALRESEASYHGVMDLCPDAITINEVETGRYVDVNKAFLRQTGYSAAEVIGRTPAELSLFATPEDQRRLGLALRQGSIDGLELRFRAKDGKLLEDLVSGRRIQFKGKECFLFVATIITPLKEIQQALRESEESYRRVLEVAPDAISITRLADGQYFEINDTFCLQTGYRRDEVIGRTALDINIYADPADRKRMVTALREKGRVDGMQIVFRAKDGALLTDLVSARIMQFKNEECVLVVATLINDLKEAQRALVESERRYRSILEAAPDAICLTRLCDGKYIEANGTFYQRTGYTAEETIGRTSAELNIYADQGDRAKLIEGLRRDGQVDGLEVLVRYKDGTLSHNLWSCRVIEHNGEACLLVVAKEIDDLKAIQKALAEKETTYRTILETAPYSITITSLSDSRYMHVNEGYCQRTGYTKEEVIGRSTVEIGIFKDPKAREHFLDTFRRTGRVDGMELQFQGKGDRITESLVSARSIVFEGHPCLLTVSTNIDELKAAQRALAESERSYRAILNSAPYAITISRITDARYLYVNKAFCENTGFSREEVIGHTTPELNLYADFADREKMIDSLRRNGKLDGMEIRFRRKDGAITTSLVSSRAIDFKGEPCMLVITTNIDAIKQIQKALAESEEAYRSILDTAPYTIVVTRLSDSRYVSVNPAYCRRTGYTEEETIGRTSLELNLYENPADRDRMLATLGTRGQVEGMEIRFRTKDGRILESLVSMTPIRYRGEDCILSMTVDINALKEAQRALQASEASYRKVIQVTPNPMVVTRRSDQRIVEVNDAFCRNSGYSRDEAIGVTTMELNLYADPSDRQKVMESRAADGHLEAMEIRFRAKDGTIRETLLSVTPLSYRGEEGFLTSTVDVTALKDFQRALKESEANYRRILESAPYSIVITRLSDNRYIQVNEAFCRRTGFSREEAVGHSPYELDIFVDPDARRRMLEVFRRDGKVEGMEIQFRAKNGRILESLFSVTPINYHGVDCLLAMTVDISERKHIERELEQYRHHLEDMVQARTKALEAAQAELVKREKLAVLGQLTATVSHELRNPLGVIRSSNFFLQRKITDRDEKVEKHFRRIEEQVALCDAIVADLLEFTRGRTVSMVKEDPTPWLIQVIEQLQESQGIPIAQELARPLPVVPHDPEKMRRVVINVLDNAIQAVKAKMSDENGVPSDYRAQVSVKTHFADNKVVIEVTDNGVGMAPDTLQRAFEPLFTTRARGTGIGLAIVKKVVNEHGGDVFLESTLGKGTHVTLALPCNVKPQGSHG